MLIQVLLVLNTYNLLTTIIEFLLPGILPMPESPIIILVHMHTNIINNYYVYMSTLNILFFFGLQQFKVTDNTEQQPTHIATNEFC